MADRAKTKAIREVTKNKGNKGHLKKAGVIFSLGWWTISDKFHILYTTKGGEDVERRPKWYDLGVLITVPNYTSSFFEESGKKVEAIVVHVEPPKGQALDKVWLTLSRLRSDGGGLVANIFKDKRQESAKQLHGTRTTLVILVYMSSATSN